MKKKIKTNVDFTNTTLPFEFVNLNFYYWWIDYVTFIMVFIPLCPFIFF